MDEAELSKVKMLYHNQALIYFVNITWEGKLVIKY